MLLIWLLVVLLSLWIFARRLLPYLIARIVSLFLKDAKFRIGGFGWRRLQLQKTRLRIRNLNLHVSDLRFVLINRTLPYTLTNLHWMMFQTDFKHIQQRG